tara:strand:- start:22 stop:195 length:174 start_codon:yes stop_codon:yes gene_type:complete
MESSAAELFDQTIPEMIESLPNLTWLHKQGKHIDFDYKRGQAVSKLIKAQYVSEKES